MKETLVNAANVLVPAYLALIKKGYSVKRLSPSKHGKPEEWCATKGRDRFLAEDTLSLLGIVSLYELRGHPWQASDIEIESFFEQFP